MNVETLMLSQDPYTYVEEAGDDLPTVAAIKRVKLPFNEEAQERKLREVRILADLSHPNILKMNHAWIETPPNGWQTQYDERNGIEDLTSNLSFEITLSSSDTEGSETVRLEARPMFLYIETEECRCDLRYWLDNEKDSRLVLTIFKQLLNGLLYLHKSKVIHRDVKPTNVFLEKSPGLAVKLGDFGLCTRLKFEQDELPSGMNSTRGVDGACGSGSKTTNVGTALYQAPEQEDQSKYGPAVDVYSLGLIALELFLDLTDPGDRREALIEAKNGNIKAFEYRDVVKKMLHLDPDQRSNCQTILSIISKK